jgi:S-adenosylmethionine:tRNA ribosyltransferase-isomerase
MLVARPAGVRHARFSELGEHLRPGDLLVVNTSGTLAAAVDGRRRGGRAVTVHFATALDDGDWVVEVRPSRNATGPLTDLSEGERMELPHGVELIVVTAHPTGQQRLWRARVAVEGGVVGYLARVGRPIRYSYVRGRYPLASYQTVFAHDPGSAEMPSAARPFSADLVTDLVTRGIRFAPVLLHTGVSSQEPGEPPQPERFRVPEHTARLVNATRRWGGRVVAVGTTVVRALESARRDGRIEPFAGETQIFIFPGYRITSVDGLITNFHLPESTLLMLVSAFAGRERILAAYRHAVAERYRFFSYGDAMLIWPPAR